jgi:hypothetical protein
MLQRHLSMLGLDNIAQVRVGDFRSQVPVRSRLLFCDALHDEKEINSNAPALKEWIAPGSILACHDVGGSPALIELLRGHVKLGHGVAIDTLYVAEVSC